MMMREPLLGGLGVMAMAVVAGLLMDRVGAKPLYFAFAVTTALWTSVLPTLPPRELITCYIVARSKNVSTRTITATIDRVPVAGQGRVNWMDGPLPASAPAIDGPTC